MARCRDLEATLALADAVSIPVILSGGVSSMEDLIAIMAADHSKLEGVISGRAVYDGRIDPGAAVSLLAKSL
jgi:phosphoribosylformimino-5-aminoimidazole carboxamide ribotide isomerase